LKPTPIITENFQFSFGEAMNQDANNVLNTASPLLLFMAIAAGVSVANLYYAQPLLHTLATDFKVSEGAAGIIITMTQLGYALGLVLLVPLGDLLERRRLITRISIVAVVALVAAALSPRLFWFDLACLFIGISAVVAQILVPFAAHLARDADRGRVVGRVMSGLLMGILLARVASGLVSDVLGWRGVYWIAAGMMLLQSIGRDSPTPPCCYQSCTSCATNRYCDVVLRMACQCLPRLACCGPGCRSCLRLRRTATATP